MLNQWHRKAATRIAITNKQLSFWRELAAANLILNRLTIVLSLGPTYAYHLEPVRVLDRFKLLVAATTNREIMFNMTWHAKV